jgi:hypothetical protein
MGVALACAGTVVWAGRDARAQQTTARSQELGNSQVPVIVLTTTTAPQGEAAGQLGRINAALQGTAQLGPALGQLIRERFGRRPPTTNTLADVNTRIAAARSAYSAAAASTDTAAMNTALETLERIAGEIEAQPDILATFPDAREQLARALLFVADTTIQTTANRADDAIRRLATIDPQRVLTARAASSAVRQAFSQRVQDIANAALVVRSPQPGCEVFRDGRSVGNTPAQLSNLSPGSHHRISIRCGGRTSLMHPVTLGAGTNSTIDIDVQLDTAIDLLDAPSLRYETLEAGRDRWVQDLARIGGAIGAQRVMGVIPSEDKVIVVDVVSATITGESPITDGAQMRRLAFGHRTVRSGSSSNDRQGGSASRPSSGQTAGTNSGGLNSGPTVDVPGGSGAPRPPQYREEQREIRSGVPAGAFVIGALGLGAIGAGVALGAVSQSALNRAQQLGELPTDVPRDRDALLENAALYNYLAIGSYALGGALVVTGTLYGIFGRSTTTITERIRISAAPTRDGAALVVGGTL